MLKEIILGGLEVMQAAECVILGDHSVRDEEIKFGYAVTGLVEPSRVLTNAGAEPGDALVLTKTIGTDVITTALKQGRARETVDGEGLRLAEGRRLLLYDPQASGGLLISLSQAESEAVVRKMRHAGYPAARIGSVQAGTPKIVLQ